MSDMNTDSILALTLDIAPMLAYLGITPDDMRKIDEPPDRGWEVASQLLLALMAARMKAKAAA